MKILYFGGGYVGTCSAAASADSGHQILVYDINSELVKRLSSQDRDVIESCLFEEGLGELVVRNRSRIKFTDNISEAEQFVDEADAVFMCLPTPEKDSTGETNLSYYEKAAQNLAAILVKRNNGSQSRYMLIVNKSTVPIGMSSKTQKIMDSAGVKNYSVGANPEFLIEGKAVKGSVSPQRIVVGAIDKKDFAIFRDIYNRYTQAPNVDYIEVNPDEAEAGKLLANYMLFNRLANCFDVVGRMCEIFDNLYFENVRRILITDNRIGDWGFYDSLFAGGSCLPKDARSLSWQIRNRGAAADIVDSALAANQRQLDNFLARAKKELAFSWQGKKVGLLGLSFKRDSDDVRNSPALGITEFLLKSDVAEIKAYDPVASDNYFKYFSSREDAKKICLTYSEIKAMTNVDALIIATDWPQFRELYETMTKYLPQGALVMDGRRMLTQKYEELAQAGYNIIAVGSPLIKAA